MRGKTAGQAVSREVLAGQGRGVTEPGLQADSVNPSRVPTLLAEYPCPEDSQNECDQAHQAEQR